MRPPTDNWGKGRTEHCFCGNRNGHHDTKPRMLIHIIGQNAKRHYTKTNINNIYKTWALLESIRSKDVPNIGNSNGHHNTELTTQTTVTNLITQTIFVTRHRTKTQHRKLNRWTTRTPPTNRGWTQVLAKGKQFLLLIRHRRVIHMYSQVR